MTKKNTDSVCGMSAKSEGTLDLLLAQYVAGKLPLPVHALIGGHLELNPSSQAVVRQLEESAAARLSASDEIDVMNRDAMINEIVNSAPLHYDFSAASAACPVVPRALQRFSGYDAVTMPWKTKLPGYREALVGEIDGCEAKFLWIRPGRAMPNHTHEGSELTLVLEGSFADEDGIYRRGDISAADETIDHRPVAGEGVPCICFAVTTAPLKLTGSFRQLFSDVFGH